MTAKGIIRNSWNRFPKYLEGHVTLPCWLEWWTSSPMSCGISKPALHHPKLRADAMPSAQPGLEFEVPKLRRTTVWFGLWFVANPVMYRLFPVLMVAVQAKSSVTIAGPHHIHFLALLPATLWKQYKHVEIVEGLFQHHHIRACYCEPVKNHFN